ncbi:DgyrCDS4521 [Dimorphilus gyrociliatus]|uniref:Insulin-degrading enzyme n=1 Tax=Dimorphilus gyrociliatus TaxID=2664684 RepID=A0A7I8VHA4_9ANNE|nr:DgyrCDS4521 [Dimorphilus gyrociliatus]
MATSDMISKRHENIVKSQEDGRQYLGLELKNKMKILLVSDSQTDKSSAALDVYIGAMKDPKELPGLAHFCEHMLFLGTEKYPEENEYNKFLSENGGSSNAYTSGEHTNYYFDVSPSALSGALDRFAQFFLCPLFTISATDREVNAVNSENMKNLQSDMWRLHQLEKSTAKPDHDFAKFSTGSKETLETIPLSKGLKVRDELLKFHQKYYSSNIMGLCVVGKESLEELTEMVVPLFGDVKNKSVDIPEWKDHPYGPEQLKKLIKIVPVKDIRNLYVNWPIPDLRNHYRSNPGHYLGHLIGHEGPGSLLSELKEKGWVNELVGGQKIGARGFMFFTITVDLSESGIDHIDDIMTAIFEYLHMLKKRLPEEWIFQECKNLNNITFRFKDKEKPRSLTSSCAGVLHDFPMDEILSGPYLLHEYEPNMITDILNRLTPDNLRVGIVGKTFENECDQTERWYGTNYRLEDIGEETLQRWRNVGDNPKFNIPEKNEFIPSRFDLVELDNNKDVPKVIKDTTFSRVWFKQDGKFKMPKLCISIDMASPYCYADPLSANLSYMFVTVFKDALTEYAYDAELAGLYYDLTKSMYGIKLSVKGYSDKQHVLLEKILKKMVSFEVNVDRFNILKELYIRSLRNFEAEQPHQHAIYYLSALTTEVFWEKSELLAVADQVTSEALQAFIPKLLSKLYFEILIYGNSTLKRAQELSELVEKELRGNVTKTSYLPEEQRRYREVCLPQQKSYVYIHNNEVHKDNAVEIYLQTGEQDTRSNMLLELFCQIISEPCFDILRTQEQLGYLVFSGIRRSSGAQGLRIIIQSDKTPQHIEERIESFIEKMGQLLSTIDDVSFERHVQALATKRLESPKKLSAQNSKYWEEITSKHYNFRRDEIEVDYLRTLTKSDIIDFFKNKIENPSEQRRKLSVHVYSTADGSEKFELPTESQATIIKDINSLRETKKFFPNPKPFIDPSKSKL